ncbi:hypothetical protein [Actinoallomurus iriomotensis]|uniref:Uncharacterized protein n=1 Tax=Actinoallomurus iriomotensis TaxID=478107 RepID=A0A9W6W4K6_9ACTN|nr:hypothetical protein [Actinoallomurus iriomotensis]GLY90052.1 hypothetical protein Airi02_079810 [Actinoallomurus iriomotensis]
MKIKICVAGLFGAIPLLAVAAGVTTANADTFPHRTVHTSGSENFSVSPADAHMPVSPADGGMPVSPANGGMPVSPANDAMP